MVDNQINYGTIGSRLRLESINHERQHSTVVVHPTCNRKVVGSNPTAGFQAKSILTLAGLAFCFLADHGFRRFKVLLLCQIT